MKGDAQLPRDRPQLRHLDPKRFDLFLERDHLQLTADDDLLELFQIEDLLLKVRLRPLQVVHDLFVARMSRNTPIAPITFRPGRGAATRSDGWNHLAERYADSAARYADAAFDDLA